MQPLDKSLRNKLERTIKYARDIAEAAARAALEQLGVGEAAPFPHLSENERDLRRKLRVHGRQLGDSLNGGKVQSMDRLIEEVAYEHWHRMLFARFLAENNLLMYPDPTDPVPVSLEECEDLAPDEGASNGWELAARFAARMLPQIFRPDSPVFLLVLPPEHQQKLERLVAELPHDVFTASDSLGWVYQFWQARKKDEVNAAEVKIGARELPAVTQLFTEPYMVAFLLDNALGAWWAARRLAESDLKQAQTEEELRRKAAIPGVPLEYLRFVKTPDLTPDLTSDLTPQPPLHEWRGGFKQPVVARNYVTQEKIDLARQFRKEPTPKEAEVWEWLRDHRMLGLKWRRQQIIEGFIADFYCPQERLALELDGGVHNSPEAQAYDEAREQVFTDKGIRTLRIKNQDCTQNALTHLLSTALTSPQTSPLTSPPASLSMNGEGEFGEGAQEPVQKVPSPFMERGFRGEVRVKSEAWTPAAGTFDNWPGHLSQLKTLDPCCGSGHFLVAAFLMLVPMRMELEGLSAREAVNRVLSENIHGLELDQRCVELAAFALALTAWRYPNAGGYRPLPELHLACTGLSVSVAKEEWKALALDKKNLAFALDWMHDAFQDAPVLGSLLSPEKTSAAMVAVKWSELFQTLNQALAQERTDEQQEAGVVAQGLAKAAALLNQKYQWIITNVPYLARGKQTERLRDFCDKHYPAGKNDLATVFLDRCLELTSPPTSPPSPLSINGEGEVGGTVSVVLPQNWLFLTSYKKFREKLLKNDTWHLIARLGESGFDSSAAAGAFTALLTISQGNASAATGLFATESNGNLIRGVDVSEPRTAAEKAIQLVTAEMKQVEQAKQLENPDARVALEETEGIGQLSKFAFDSSGCLTSDGERFYRFYWEQLITEDWEFLQSTVTETVTHEGRNQVIFWEKAKGELFRLAEEMKGTNHAVQNWKRGQDVWGKQGIAISSMRKLPVTIYDGFHFDNNTAAVVPHNPTHLLAIWCFCSSPEYNEAVRQIDQSLKVTNATLVKVPFDLEYWSKVAEEKYPNGLPKPYSDDPTQWIFHGHPCGSVVWDEAKKWTAIGPTRIDATVLQVAVARLLGYHWPAELDLTPKSPLHEWRGDLKTENPDSPSPNSPSPFMERGLGGEVRGQGGEVKGKIELSDESRFWVTQTEALMSFVDDDGIVCIPPVRGEAAAVDRLLNLLAAAYNRPSNSPSPNSPSPNSPSPNSPSPFMERGSGGEVKGEVWSNDILSQLLNASDHAGKSLETWLRDKFFIQHCKLFHHRPFIWQIWDGLRDGFSALVNYHKFDTKLLETLIYTYLGDWISRQKQDLAAGVDGAEEKLAAAEVLKKKLELILKGEAPYDIFVRWKPLEKQPMGWEPDLNDGVRLNIRPFMTVPDVSKKGAGVLRDKPNIDWGKDRGKDVESAPWYHQFNGERINDHHLTLAEKRAAREAKETSDA